MSLSKKGFAELIESSIKECRIIREKSKSVSEEMYSSSKRENIENNNEYKYYRYMEKLIESKLNRLYFSLSNPAYKRIMSMTDDEISEYKNEKNSEISNEINRLMLLIEVSTNEAEKSITKEKIEILIEEQTRLKNMSFEEMKDYIIAKLQIVVRDDNKDSNVIDETTVLENITKDDETLTNFFSMLKDYRRLEKEIKTIRGEQIIIYNDLLASNIKSEMSIEELFSEEALTKLQNKIAKVLEKIVDAETCVKKNFGSKTKYAYYKLKALDYKYEKDGKLRPYDIESLEIFQSVLSPRLYELMMLQNDEWIALNKKIFKTTDVNSRIASLCMEIDETKNKVDFEIRKWYKNIYCDNNTFGPISSRITGKFEYSLGAKDALSEFVNYGVWPTDKELETLKLSIKLNKAESEKSIIYAEQIKEKLNRLYNKSLDDKKKELEDLENKMIELVGNWNNPIILSIINEA